MCPGGIYCGEIFHWVLIMWELLAPYLICLFLMPLVVKARVKDAYVKTKKDDDYEEKITLKNKKVAIEIVNTEEKFEFKGNMSTGMAYLQLLSVLLVIWSSLFVWWTRHEVIFP